MKAVMLMLLIGLPALAGTREATDVENAWTKLQMLTHGMSADAVDHAKSHGMTITDMAALQAYVAESRERLAVLSRAFWSDMCANRDGDTEQLTQRWERYASEKHALKQSIVDGLPEVIGETTASAFFEFVADKRKSSIGGFDAVNIRSGEVDLQNALHRACDREEASDET